MKYILALIISILSICAIAQENSYSITTAENDMHIDGVLSEAIWNNAQVIETKYEKFPNDKELAETRTEVMLSFDQEFLYIAAICHDEVEGNYVIQSLKRDFSFPVSDAFAVFINPTGDNINGFSFAVNPFGAQREGVLQRGGVFGVSKAWDNIWYSAVKRSDKMWVVEMAIPFTTLRYDKNLSTWKMNFARNDLKRNETSTWIPVPVNQNVANLSFTGDLVWPGSPPKTGFNAAFIPYSTAGTIKDLEAVTQANNVQSGVDAKIALTSNLNLDLTYNPDFSQVDIDAQQINLTQFNLFFPEQRKFFIENADLFSQYGFTKIRPFYSRRIGQSSSIKYGARITGKLDENWRVGLMNVQAGMISRNLGDTTSFQEENYTIATVQRKIGAASDIGILLLNQTGIGDTFFNTLNWNRIGGIEYNLASADRKWLGEAFYHHSLQPGSSQYSGTHATFLRYQTAKLNWNWNHEYVGKDYTAVLGFVPRQNWAEYDADQNRFFTRKHTYWRIEPSMEYFFYPKNSKVFKHGPGVYYSDYMDHSFVSTDSRLSSYYVLVFLNGSSAKVIKNQQKRRLIYPFYISGTSAEPLAAGNYYFGETKAEYYSNKRKPFYYGGLVSYGSFFTGEKLSFNGNMNYRIQPWGILSTNISYNDITLPAPYTSTNLILIGAKAELSFTKNLYFTSFLQYNTQADNFNIYNRLQYRFKPMSDFFVVYSDNYDVLLNKKNSTLVIKFVYWLNS